MAQSKAFVDASHSLNELSHALALLESENSSLRGAVDGFTSENTRLRSELESVGIASYLYGRSDLKAENAKLRELVRDMHKALFSLNLDHCQACPREDACVFMHKSFDCNECAFEHDMRELGVEVEA